MSFFSFLKQQDGFLDIAQHKPERYRPFVQMVQDIMRGEGELSFAEREIIGAYVAGLNACTFCVGAHRAVAEAFGVDGNTLETLINDDNYDVVDEKLRPCLALTKKLTQSPSRITQQDVDAILAAGWSEDTAHDVIAITAEMNFANRMVSGHGVVGSPEYYRREGEKLGPNGGYGK